MRIFTPDASIRPSRRQALRLGVGAIVMAAAGMAVTSARAMGVSPFVIDLNKNGQGMTATITVENNFKTPLPVEMRVEALDFDANGVVETHKDPGDLIVFPMQAIIEPGQSRVFRVQYAGAPPTEKSKHYYVTAAQLPVDLGKDASEVQVVYAFNVLLSIPVPGAKAHLRVTKGAIGHGDKDPSSFFPILTVENAAITYGYFKNGKLKLTQTNSAGKVVFAKTFDATALEHIVGWGLIGPGQTRDLPLNIPLPSGEGQLKAEYSYEGG